MNNIKNKDIMTNNDVPDIVSIGDANPTLASPNSPYVLPFYQTEETKINTDDYREFINNAITRFRKSRTYTNYKGFLIGLGLDRCQVHGNITNEMATIEMHHNMLTIFDIALIISEHVIATTGKICTFDLIELLSSVHTNHKVQLVMLSLTPHQIYHHTEELFIHPDQCIGDWVSFLDEYKFGVTVGIARKVIWYIDKAIREGKSSDSGILDLRAKLIDWSVYNDRNGYI